MGGADSVLERARASFDAGDYRWVAEVVNKVVFAEPNNQAARDLQADALEQMAYQTENTTWRNAYLTGAMELRNGVNPSISAGASGGIAPDLLQAITPAQFFDVLAVRLNANRMEGVDTCINWHFTESDTWYAMSLRNGVLTYRANARREDAAAEINMSQALLPDLGLRAEALEEAIANKVIKIDGDASQVDRLMASLDTFTSGFNIITPAVLSEN